MRFYRHRRKNGVPGLNTASLPDLIFTVLFFFMIVTHMRKAIPKVTYQVPAGTELTRLTKKSAVAYIYIGKVTDAAGKKISRIQLNDKLTDVEDVMDYVVSERERMSPEDQQKMTVSIRADQQTEMGLITDVKQMLRKSNTLKINYSAVSRQSDK